MPESLPSNYPDNKCLEVCSPFEWPTGQVPPMTLHPEDTPRKPKNNPSSYLERLYNAFPQDQFVADGNFRFSAHHKRFLEEGTYNDFLIPIAKKKKQQLTPQQMLWNQRISEIRSVI